MAGGKRAERGGPVMPATDAEPAFFSPSSMLAKFKQRLRSRRYTAQEDAAVFSGLALLPSEILGGKLFPLVVRTEIHDGIHDDLWHRKLLTLAGVCTQWRNIVHSTPLLWNQCICINTRQFSRVGRFREERIIKKYFEAVRMCLMRSAPLPVSISIDWFALLNIMSDAAVRVESLRISSSRVCILRALERLPTGTLQALTTIDISCERSPAHNPFPFSLTAQPRRVELISGWHPLDLSSTPWLQLTHVTLTAPPLACLAVLARCSNLVSAVLHHIIMYTSLAVDRDTAPTTATLVHLPLGNVRRLTLMAHGAVQSADLCALLRCTAGVTELKLLTPFDTENAFLDALGADIPSTELLLPQLEMLWIDSAPNFSRRGQRSNSQMIVAFQAMIASRVGAGLRRLVYKPPNLEHNSQLCDELMLAVAAFSVNGLHVEVL
ncbi:hypothetical protein C8F04DRAFT_1067357 [Mycena alexandri]|uniref:F-box domain-containing protein n=1 Tax=Mycena alexandri TaxID=1745969 RepID=A0AAD6XEH9_9AGAR|nr:hypothetical protein C8F04DRAFT_1067357 [Mycena alexandri]